MRRPRRRNPRPNIRPSLRLGSSFAILMATTALAPISAWAQTETAGRSSMQGLDQATEVESVIVTGIRAEDQVDLIADEIARRNTSSVADLLQEISGVSLNSLYSRPEVSVGVQGIAGHGRVVQQLEGISQNFHAFTPDIGQTGSIFIDPMMLAGIDVTRGGKVGTATLGGLGGAVNFRYLGVSDILDPGQTFGGQVRATSGVGDAGNGQNPAGSAFIAGRGSRWDWMVGGAYVDNDAYEVGSRFDRAEMAEHFRADNIKFYDGVRDINPEGGCHYTGITGMLSGSTRDGVQSCQLSLEQADLLGQAAASGPLEGTEKRTYSALLRAGYDIEAGGRQRLDLFAVTSGARYRTEQAPRIFIGGGWRDRQDGDPAAWGDDPWDVGTELESTVASLRYNGTFSSLFNPTVTAFFEQQNRRQDWIGLSGSWAYGAPLHYDVENRSFGLKLDNASYFDLAFVGPVRLDLGVEAKRMDKTVDAITEQTYLWLNNNLTDAPVWDPDSQTDTWGAAISLSTQGSGPLHVTAGLGWQRVDLTAHNPKYLIGNHAKAGVDDYTPRLAELRTYYRSLGYSSSQARTLAAADLAGTRAQWMVEYGKGSEYYVSGPQSHSFDLRSGHFALEYAHADSGLTGRAQISYNERAPTSNEMYGNGVWNLVLFVVNPDLKPEQNLSLQLGVDYAHEDVFGDDQLKLGALFYRNEIENFINYGPIVSRHGVVSENPPLPLKSTSAGGIANVNNLETVVRQGFELNLDYSRPLFSLRGAVTLPLRLDNRTCSWHAPGGQSYLRTQREDLADVYTDYGLGDRICYSGWNWMETSLIQPITGALTATFIPFGERLELGGTVHYRGRQRSAYQYIENAQRNAGRFNSLKPLPDGDGWLTINLFPEVVKLDLFANYEVNERVSVGAYLANATNQMEGTPTTFGYNFNPGRTLKVNLQYRF